MSKQSPLEEKSWKNNLLTQPENTGVYEVSVNIHHSSQSILMGKLCKRIFRKGVGWVKAPFESICYWR